MTRVLFLSPYPRSVASHRVRIEQYLPRLRAAGIDPVVRSLFSEAEYRGGAARAGVALLRGIAQRLAEALTARRWDAVVVHREALPLGTAIVERLVGRLARRALFDFDDAVYLPQPRSTRPLAGLLRSPRKFDAIVSAVDVVLAGNAMLAGRARRAARDVRVLPTAVDTDRFTPRTSAAGEGVVLGWIGSPSTSYYLAEIVPALRRVLARHPQARVEIVGARLPEGLPERAAARPWTLAGEVDDLRGFDVGLMPLADDEWTRGKCGYKALQYMSVGIPTVSSPVGVAADMIREGANGSLATDEDSWVRALSSLVEDASVRRAMGAAARDDAVARWSVAAWSPLLVDALLAK